MLKSKFNMIIIFFKKYWLILLIILLLILPKIVDGLYDFYLFDFLSMNHIEPSDLLTYLGTIASGLFTLAAVIVAIKQFTTEKLPIILPRSEKFYISSDLKKLHFRKKPIQLNAPTQGNIELNSLVLENVSDNSAISFDLVFDYNDGKWHKELCNSLDAKPILNYPARYKKDEYIKQGVFNPKSNTEYRLPPKLRYTIKDFVHWLNDSSIDKEVLSLRKKHLLDKRIKIGELKIITKDINRRTNTTIFDIEVEMTTILNIGYLYKSSLHYVFHED